MSDEFQRGRRNFLGLSVGATAGLLSNACWTTEAATAESLAAPAITANESQGCSLEYEYSLCPWARNWSQIFAYEWQNYQSVDKILADIRIVDTVTSSIQPTQTEVFREIIAFLAAEGLDHTVPLVGTIELPGGPWSFSWRA